MEHKYKIGQKVRVKQWDDMVNEYGCDNAYSVNVPYDFTLQMKEFCGHTYIIIDVSDVLWNNQRISKYKLSEIDNIEYPSTLTHYAKVEYHSFSDEMLLSAYYDVPFEV